MFSQPDAQKVVELGSLQFIDENKTQIIFTWPKDRNDKTLLIKGFRSTNEETIRLFLENKRSGGGDIEDLQFNKSKGQVTVTFVDAEG